MVLQNLKLVPIINISNSVININNGMATKLYKYGTDKLPMKVLKNLHED